MDYFEYVRAIRASDLSYKARIVALIIASYYNWSNKNVAFPSNKIIASGTGLSVRSVIRAKEELVSQGYLVSNRQWNSANQYIPQCPVGSLNNNINNKLNNNNKSSSEDLYISNTKKMPEEIIEIKEMTAASPWDGWR